MADVPIFALQCPSCGAKLNVAKSLDVFACAYCGASIKLAQSGGTVALELIAGELAGVRRGTDKTAAELALRRLKEKGWELNREAVNLRQRETDFRTDFMATRNRLRAGRFPVAVLLLLAAVIWALLYATIGGRFPYSNAVIATLVIAASLYVHNVITRGVDRQISAVDEREKVSLESHAILEKKLAAEIALNAKKIAEAQSVADS